MNVKFLKAAALMIFGLVLFIAAAPAHATPVTETFDWTLTGPAASLGGVPFPGSGTITATISAGSDIITGITGTIDGSMIAGLTTFGSSPSPASQVIFPTGTTFLSTAGIAFDTASGLDVNIFSFFPQGTPPSGNAYGELTSGGFGVGTFSLTPVSATPLPAALPLFATGVGVLGLLGWLRKRRNAGSFAAASFAAV